MCLDPKFWKFKKKVFLKNICRLARDGFLRKMSNCQLLAINYPFFLEIPKNMGFSTPKINNFLFVAISLGDELDFLVRHRASRRRTVFSSLSPATNKIFAFLRV